VVYFRGFTRQLLDDPSGPSSGALVERCSEAVSRISTGKQVVVIDGVGYPSVGSVVGCSSADIAVACAAPVLLVGKPGVGDAVDSFNLCARYFEAQRVPVLGAIFNRLAPSGFYSLDTCRSYVTKYMAWARPRQRVYGMLPRHEVLSTLGADETCGFSFERPKAMPSVGPMTVQDRAAVAALSVLFREHVNIKQLLMDLEEATARPLQWTTQLPQYPTSTGPPR